MLKLILILCVAIYACMVIFSDPAVTPVADRPETEAAAPEPVLESALREDGGRTTLTTADGQVLEISAVIAPGGEETGAQRDPAGADVPDAATDPEVGPTDAGLPTVEVTGTRVNLRSGPSTDTEILAALSEGTRAEVMATLADGWAQIRVIETGVEGYMADRFLARVN